MKKILLATTILSMSAGFAAAEVAVSGSARMGIVSTDSSSVFSSRVRMSFSGTGTTDGGLAFGGKFDAQDTQAANAGTSGSVFISGAFGKISMGGVDSGDAAAVGQLASVGYTGLGSTNSINYAADGFDLFGLGALNAKGAPTASVLTGINTDSVIGGYYFDDEDVGYYNTIATTVKGGAAAKVLYTYTAGDLSASVSTGQISNGAADMNSYGVGVAYTSGGLTLAAGYGSNDFAMTTTVSETYFDASGNGLYIDPNLIPVLAYSFAGSVTDATVSAKYVMGATTLKAIYQDKQMSASVSKAVNGGTSEDYADVDGSATSMGLSVSHTIDALTLTAFGVTTDLTTNMISFVDDQSASFTRTGIGASYNLGGGATFTAGAVRVEAPTLSTGFHSDGVTPDESIGTASYSAYDVGVTFSF